MAAQLHVPPSRALDANGSPLSGAKWYYYESGTDTPAPIYTSAALTTEHANPVVADSGGKFPNVYFDSALDYRAVLESADGSITLHDIDPANTSGGGGGGTITVGNYPISIFNFIPEAEWAGIMDGSSTYDCTDAIHEAVAYVDGTGAQLIFPMGEYWVTHVQFTGSNYTLHTDGCKFKQVAGLTGDGENHFMLEFAAGAHDIRMGDIRGEGNIDTDEGEWSHIVAVVGASNITLGNIWGENVRGDVLYTNGTVANPQRNLVTGVIYGRNVYRCIVAQAGGDAVIQGIVNEGQIGYADYRAEPNSGGTYQPVSADIGFVYGSVVAITSDDPTVINTQITFGRLDLDNDRTENSSAPYPNHGGAGAFALAINRVESVQIGLLKLRNYVSYPVSFFDLWKSVTIDTFDFANCNSAETTFKSLFVVQPAAGAQGVWNVRVTRGTLTRNDNFVYRGPDEKITVHLGTVDISGGLLGANLKGSCGSLTMNCGNPSSDVVVFPNFDQFHFGQATVTNCASTTGFHSCQDVVFGYLSGTFGTVDAGGSLRVIAITGTVNGNTVGGINSLTGDGKFAQKGVQIVGAKQTTYAAATGGSVIDVQARQELAEVKLRLQQMGIIA